MAVRGEEGVALDAARASSFRKRVTIMDVDEWLTSHDAWASIWAALVLKQLLHMHPVHASQPVFGLAS